jgi:hypothetical protein
MKKIWKMFFEFFIECISECIFQNILYPRGVKKKRNGLEEKLSRMIVILGPLGHILVECLSALIERAKQMHISIIELINKPL